MTSLAACSCSATDSDETRKVETVIAEVSLPSLDDVAKAPTPEPAAAPSERPLLGIRGFATTVYAEPSDKSNKLGYLRVGALVPRSEEVASRRGCKGGWYRIEPQGYVCAGKRATTDLDDPLLRAAARRPDRTAALPYRYGFVRSVLPLYLRVPTAQQQHKSEFKLEEHLAWFKEHKSEVQTASLGAHDVALDARGIPISGRELGALGERRNTIELSLGELFGGRTDDDPWPFWLRDGQRLIPNISGFDVPESAVFADRARRHTGLAFIGSFQTGPHSLQRRFAVTTDLRLAPTTKIKPDSASPWHGVAIDDALQPPFAWVSRREAKFFRVEGGVASEIGGAPRRSLHRLSGKVSKADGIKYFETTESKWLRQDFASVVVRPRKLPKVAKRGEKWIQVDLSEQVLVLWEGTTPVYATMVSTGRPAIGDPDKTTATPRGTFKIYAKHLAATMDSDEGASQRGMKPGDDGYVPEKGDGVYGVTKRRGHGLFKLRNVPHIQYFHRNYALHGAYWHDVFGIARSHGCINLAPIDSHRVFEWTEPGVPNEWHGVRTEGGTTVVIHK